MASAFGVMNSGPKPAVRFARAMVLALAVTCAPATVAQRPDLSGTWERTGPGQPAVEWTRVAAESATPCNADQAQLRLLRAYTVPGTRFTATHSESTLLIGGAGGSPSLLHLDGREGKLSAGGVDVAYRARWASDSALAIEWGPVFGGTVLERYTLTGTPAVLQLDQTIEHRALLQPVSQRFTYRRVVDPPAPPSPVNAPQAAVGQVADTAFRPVIDRPAYPVQTGPVVMIDEAHANFHTATGRYLPFAELLRRDGYVVKSSTERFTGETLRETRILVIANAREALSAAEVTAVHEWVSRGGSLLLIVDHPPFVESSIDLASAFRVRLLNRGAADLAVPSGRIVFRKSDGTLKEHAITQGIEEIVTFTGSAFEIESGGQPLLVLGRTVCSSGLELDVLPLQGHLQGAVLPSGAGRVAVFAEAAMFSAQVTGPNRSPMGMNDPTARDNAPFLLNVMHWLSRR